MGFLGGPGSFFPTCIGEARLTLHLHLHSASFAGSIKTCHVRGVMLGVFLVRGLIGGF